MYFVSISSQPCCFHLDKTKQHIPTSHISWLLKAGPEWTTTTTSHQWKDSFSKQYCCIDNAPQKCSQRQKWQVWLFKCYLHKLLEIEEPTTFFQISGIDSQQQKLMETEIEKNKAATGCHTVLSLQESAIQGEVQIR